MDVGNIAQQQIQTLMTGAAQQAATSHGAFGGQKITLSSPMSLIADSAEEASFAMSEREETKLHERKMMPKVFTKERVEQVEKYLELMEKQQKAKTIDAFISALSKSGFKTPDQAVTLALKYFDDPADAFCALHAAKGELAEVFGQAFFDEAMAQLEDGHGKEIQIHLATGAAALEFGHLDSPDGLRALYTQASEETPVETYEKILREYGESRVEEALGFLTKSLGNEMAATTSRTDKVLLRNLSRDLGVVQQLHGLYAGCKEFQARLEKAFGHTPIPSNQMMKEVLSLGKARFLGAFDIENLAGKCQLEKIEDKIRFYQEFSIMARQLSENLFSEPGVRLSIIDATQQALDDAIAVENEMYDD